MQGFFVLQTRVHSTASCFLAVSVFVLQSGSHPVATAMFRLLTFQAFHTCAWVPLAARVYTYKEELALV